MRMLFTHEMREITRKSPARLRCSSRTAIAASAAVLATAIAVTADAPRVVLPPGAGQQSGAVIDLGMAGPLGASARDINQWGLVTGTTDGATGWRGFTSWPKARLTLLTTLGSYIFAEGVNDHGDVVGQAGTAEGTHAFRTSGSRIYDLGPMFAVDINNLRFTAGWTENQAAVWTPEGAVRLLVTPGMPAGDEGGGWWSGAYAGINDRGQAAGIYTDADTGLPMAVRWEPDGSITELGIGTPQAINEAGDVAGWGFGVPGFFWSESTGWVDVWDIAPLGMNDAGQLVGICGNGTSSYDACVWSKSTGVVRLAKPVVGYARAAAINDLGEIAGTVGEWDGPAHALWWYSPPGVHDQLSAVRRLLLILRDDGVVTQGRHTALTALLQQGDRAWRAGRGDRSAAFLEQMVRLLRAGQQSGRVRDRTIHVEALLERLALRLRGQR